MANFLLLRKYQFNKELVFKPNNNRNFKLVLFLN